jgi:hypothetical protein
MSDFSTPMQTEEMIELRDAAGKEGRVEQFLEDTYTSEKEEYWQEKGPENCCRPTIECYDLIRNAERMKRNSDVFIKDPLEHQQAVCCMIEYVRLGPDENCKGGDKGFPFRW